jgi:hypothetical protein
MRWAAMVRIPGQNTKREAVSSRPFVDWRNRLRSAEPAGRAAPAEPPGTALSVLFSLKDLGRNAESIASKFRGFSSPGFT